MMDILHKIYNAQDKTKNILNLVFPSSKYKIAYKPCRRAQLKEICKKINISEITPHMLRHTFATRMLESGINVKVLSEILGHKNINITLNIYAHVLPSTMKEAMKNTDEFI
jgi:integrase